MCVIRKGDLYKVNIECFLRLCNSITLTCKTLKENKSITILDVSTSGTVMFEIDNQVYYTDRREISDLIEEGYLSLNNQTMTNSDNDNRSKIKYRIIHVLRSLLIETEYMSINEQLAIWNVNPKEFNVPVYGDINWKDPGNYEKAIHLIADKIVGE